MSAHRRRPAGRHSRRTRRPSWLRISGVLTIAVATLLACTAPATPAAPAETGATQSLRLGTYPKAPRSLEDPHRAPYGSGPHGGWTTKTPSISTAAQFAAVRDTNGVMLLGDSIARQAQGELAQRLYDEHGILTAVNNWPSRPTAPTVDWLEDHQQWIPDRGIVMAVGSNDIFNPHKWHQQVSRVLEIADGRPVYWMAVYVDRWSSSDPDQRVADARNSAWINQQLYAMANVHPNLKVVDWYAWLAQGYNESKIADVLSDGVHLTSPVGVDNWVDLLTYRMGL